MIAVHFNGYQVYTTYDLVDAYRYVEITYGITEKNWELDGITYPNGDAEYKTMSGSIKILQNVHNSF